MWIYVQTLVWLVSWQWNILWRKIWEKPKMSCISLVLHVTKFYRQSAFFNLSMCAKTQQQNCSIQLLLLQHRQTRPVNFHLIISLVRWNFSEKQLTKQKPQFSQLSNLLLMKEIYRLSFSPWNFLSPAQTCSDMRTDCVLPLFYIELWKCFLSTLLRQ